MCRRLCAYFLVCTPTSTGVCLYSYKKSSKRSWRTDRLRAVGIRVHAGGWAVQPMHCCVSRESGREAREVEGQGGGGGRGDARADPVEKLHRRRKRTRNKLRGNSIKKGGCQSGLSWLPHPVLCAKFQKRPVPSLTCGGRLKRSTEACAVGGGFRQNKPSSISLSMHSHMHRLTNITETSITQKNIHAHKHTDKTYTSSTHLPSRPSVRETQQGARLGRICSMCCSLPKQGI